MVSGMSWVDRYQAGQHVQVWTEMVGLGDSVRTGAWEEAEAVARETMRRVRENVRRLAYLLPAAGYVFDSETEHVFTPADPDAASKLNKLEALAGPIPLALRCWCEEVGLVNLVGFHPEWTCEQADPLVINSTVDYLLDEWEIWEADRNTEWDQGPFVLDLSPDVLHKANISGGAPYGLAVPNAGVDGIFLWEAHQTTFVNYLRICFRGGGFSGWDFAPGRGAPSGIPAAVAEIAAELLPI